MGKIKDKIYWFGCFWILNSLLFGVIAAGYWPWMKFYEQSALVKSYILATQFGWLSILAFVAFVLMMLLAWLPGKIVKPLCILLGFMISALLVIDVISYAQYRFHLNGFVFELFFAGGDIIAFPLLTWLYGLGILTVLFAVQGLFAYAATRCAALQFPVRRLGLVSLFGMLLFSQLLHAWEDANYRSAIPGLSSHFPLYYPLTSKSTFIEYGLVDVDESREKARLRIKDNRSGALHYPLAPVEYERPEQPMNIVFIMIDAWRYDDANAQVTPNIARWAKDATVFHQHYSGGNSTQAGIFSLFYSLYPTYWDSFKNANRRPVMMATLAEQGYHFEIHSSARLNHPPFDRTVFADIDDLRVFTPGNNPVERDQQITDDFNTFLKANDGQKPFFGFLFYDAAHGKVFPKGKPEIFKPSWNRINYLTLDNDTDPTEYRNLYRNSLYYTDEKIATVLKTLKETGQDKNTIVIISSDHGEEFNDNKQNYWGHGSNYSPAQTHVPMYLHVPDQAVKSIDSRTSHLDVMPTLMTHYMGVTTAPEQYGNGIDLFDPEAKEDWQIIGSYRDYAIVNEAEINVVNPGGFISTMAQDLRAKEQRMLQINTVQEIMKLQTRFLQ